MDGVKNNESLRQAIAALRSGNSDAARELFERILERDPSHGPALIMTARLARIAGDLDAAETFLSRASEVVGDHAQLVAEKGYLALARSNSALAIKQFEYLTILLPELADARFNLGHAYRHAGRMDAAIVAFSRALDLGISAPWEVHAEIGTALTVSRRESDARDHFQKSLSLKPGYAQALYGLGVISAAFGDFDAAEDYYRSALRSDPEFVDTYQQLADSRKFTNSDDPDILAMQELLDSPNAPAYSHEKLHFALGKAHDDCAEYDTAFEHYRQANKLKRLRVQPYDATRCERITSEVIEVFDEKFVGGDDFQGNESQQPIIIVGMPRSGTTLTEQIFCSHGEVESGGELSYFENVCRTQLAPYPLAVTLLDNDGADRIARAYLELLTEISAGGRVTDKYPANFLHLGLIAKVFPRATLVHCSRHPADNCLSIFFQDFSGANTYANLLEDVAHYYRQYERVMTHWEKVLGGRLLKVDYDALVADSETQIRRLIDHAGLEFEEACLTPGRRDGIVPTLSRWQVRQPIYKTSSGRWKNYRTHCEDLLRALGMDD